MNEGEPRSFPTNSVAKEALLYCRPDLTTEIETLSDSDVERIADRVGETIQEVYWMALEIVLVDHLRVNSIHEDYSADNMDNASSPPV